jgi:hypothetical protein
MGVAVRGVRRCLFYSFLKIYRPHSAVKFLLKLVLDGADLLADYSPGLPLI